MVKAGAATLEVHGARVGAGQRVALFGERIEMRIAERVLRRARE